MRAESPGVEPAPVAARGGGGAPERRPAAITSARFFIEWSSALLHAGTALVQVYRAAQDNLELQRQDLWIEGVAQDNSVIAVRTGRD